jgi:membrane protease YdiL (CAAX protease family)
MYQRIPVAVRAIGAGLVVQIVGVMPFMALVNLNLTVLPSVPWSAFVELILLILFVKYFHGWGWPASTQEARRINFRANTLPAGRKKSIALGGALLGMTIFLLVVAGNQIVSLPAEAIGIFVQLTEAPPLTAITIFATAAVMTGVVEEVAFRGYMQVPLEGRYGQAVAILIVAVIFALIHFPSLLILPLFVIGGIGWGVLARISNSTLPGMVVHGLVDFVFFMWVFADTEAVVSLLESSILETGVDSTFVIVASLALVSGVGTVAFLRHASLVQDDPQ